MSILDDRPPTSPPLSGESYASVVQTTEALLSAYTGDPAVPGSGWRPPAKGEMDAGGALVRVFAQMAKQIIDRLDRIPDRSFLAFLNLIGAEPAPPRSARVPLTFSLAEGSTREAVVPKGTAVGADPLPGDPGDVVFETTLDLAVTPARVERVVVRTPDGDLVADRTDVAAVGASGFFAAFAGSAPDEHQMFLSAEEILSLPTGTLITVTVQLADAGAAAAWRGLHSLTPGALATYGYYQDHPPTPPLVTWSYWNGEAWMPIPNPTFPSTPAAPGSWQMAFSLPADMAAIAIQGREARYLRARLGGFPLVDIPEIRRVTLGADVQASGLAPDVAIAGGRPLDLSMDFMPFGATPRFNDTLYIGSSSVLSRAGASVTLTVTNSAEQASLKSGETPQIAWEVWNGQAWVRLATTTPSAATVNDALRTRTLTLPASVAPLERDGTTSHWLRLRLLKADYGKGVQLSGSTVSDDGYRPPILESISLGYTHHPVVDATVVTYNAWSYEEPGGAPFVPFVRAKDTEPALYVGLDRALPNRSMMIYVQVAQLSATDAILAGATTPEVVWEYSSASGWASLGALDDTRGFAGSGLVHFIGPTDAAPRLACGELRHWLRARLSRGEPPVMPRIGRVLLNTVWATHTTTIQDEVLGSSDQTANQRFTLSNIPVLEGERIEVREPEMPPPEQRAAIERASGAPAASVAASDDGRAEEVWVRWLPVVDFHGSGPLDRHYTIDRATGDVRFGDGLRGMVPPRGVRNVRASLYKTGGGAHGDRAAGTISSLKTTIPYVDGAVNHEDATGGADRETPERVKERGPRILRHGYRAVTAQDFEDLAREASPAIARARALTPTFDPIQQADSPSDLLGAGIIALLIVPSGSGRRPSPGLGLIQDVDSYLRARSAPAVSLRISGPDWVEVDVTDLVVVPTSIDGADALRAAILDALDRFFHPLTGGPEGKGWEFGEVPHASDIHRLVSAIRGVDGIRRVALTHRYVDPGGRPPFDEATVGSALERVLVCSGNHKVSILDPEGSI